MGTANCTGVEKIWFSGSGCVLLRTLDRALPQQLAWVLPVDAYLKANRSWLRAALYCLGGSLSSSAVTRATFLHSQPAVLRQACDLSSYLHQCRKLLM